MNKTTKSITTNRIGPSPLYDYIGLRNNIPTVGIVT